jgi:protein TonB
MLRRPARNPPVASSAASVPISPAGSAAVPPASSIAEPPPKISSGWRNALTGWLGAHKQYPEEARRRSEEGRAAVRFTVERSGRVVDVALVRSTGSAILDAAVLSMLRGANLPPFPAAMTQDQVTVTIQIRYALDG